MTFTFAMGSFNLWNVLCFLLLTFLTKETDCINISHLILSSVLVNVSQDLETISFLFVSVSKNPLAAKRDIDTLSQGFMEKEVVDTLAGMMKFK